ncbi:threonine ammonia-lyase [Aliihoeflea sp. PC F10.4]
MRESEISRWAATPLNSLQAPTFDEIEAVDVGELVRTPLLESERVNGMLGGRLFLKAEGLQRTGSFKVRGVLNFIAQLDEHQKTNGVIAYSSGNHAQAVAWAAARRGMRAVLIMPRTAPAAKVDRVRAWGGEIHLIDWATTDAPALCRSMAAEHAMTMIPPFEDRRIIAGAATIGVEIAEQAAAMGAGELDAVLAGCSGGGLLAGTAIALRAKSPRTEVWGVEPENFDDLARSLAAGEKRANQSNSTTICDALSARTTGDLTFAILRDHLSGVVTVSEAAVLEAMRFAFEEFRVVLEPGGAAPLASVLSGRFPLKGRSVVVVASGSNVDASLFSRALEAPPIAA